MTAGDDGGFQPHPGDPWHPGYPADEQQASDDSEDSGGQDRRERRKDRKDRKARKEKKPRRSRRGQSELSEEALAAQAAFDPSSTAFDQADVIGDGESVDDDPFGAVLDGERPARRSSSSDEVPAPAWTVDEEPSSDQVIPVEQPSWVGQATESGGAVESVEFEADMPEPLEVPEPTASDDAEIVARDDDIETPEEQTDELAAGSVADVDVGDLLELADEPQIAGEYGVAGPEAYDVLDSEETGEVDDWDAFVQGETPSELVDLESAGFDDDVAAGLDPTPKKRRGLFKRRSQADDEEIIDDGFVGVAASDQPIEIPEVVPDAPIEERPVEASEALFGAPTEPLAGEDVFDEWVADDAPKKRRGLFRRSPVPDAEVEPYADPRGDFAAGDGLDLPAPDGYDEVPPVPMVTPPTMAESFEPQDELGAAFLPPTGDAVDEGDRTALGAAEIEPVGSADDPTALPPDEATFPDESLEDPEVAAAVAQALAALSGDEAVEALEPTVEPAPDTEVGAEPEAQAESEAGIDADVAAPAAEALLPIEDAPVAEEIVVSTGDVAEAPDAPPAIEGAIPQAPDESVVESDESTDWEGDAGRVPAAWFAEIDEDEVVPPPAGDTPETEWPVPEVGEADEVDQLEPADGEEELVAASDPTGVMDPGGQPEHVLETDLGDEPVDDWVTDGGELTGEAFNVESQTMPQLGVDAGVIAGDTDLFDLEAPEPVPEPQLAPPAIPDVPEGYEPWGAAVEGALGAGREDEFDDATYEYEPMLQEGAAPADALPEGFEQFPGEMEPFQLTADELATEMGQQETGWVTDAVDSGSGEEPEFDETIYAGQGTIEHRDLAAAIEAAGDEDTQWQAISAAMPGLETGVLGFEDVADLGSGGDYVAPVRSNLSTRVGTGLVLVTLLFGSLFLSDIAFVVFIGAMLVLGLVEFFAALRRSGYLPLTLFGLIGGAFTLVATWFHGPLALGSGILLTTMMTFFFYAFSPTRRDALANGGLTVLGVGWIIGTVGFVIPIARAADHVTLVFAVVIITAATDIGAFSFGRTWGKRPLAPVLSPNKTAEGLVGGILLALGAAAVFGFIEIGPFDLASALGLGVIIIVLAPLGDLAESMIKRSLGIKDMGSTLPGHGGVLDRIDAFLFVVPAAWAFYELVGYLG